MPVGASGCFEKGSGLIRSWTGLRRDGQGVGGLGLAERLECFEEGMLHTWSLRRGGRGLARRVPGGGGFVQIEGFSDTAVFLISPCLTNTQIDLSVYRSQTVWTYPPPPGTLATSCNIRRQSSKVGLPQAQRVLQLHCALGQSNHLVGLL